MERHVACIKSPAAIADAPDVALLPRTDPHTGSMSWTGDDSDDLLAWLVALPDCPPVTAHQVLRCSGSAHAGDPEGTALFCGFVQADPEAGVARRRCVACAQVADLFDSGERWTYPGTYECVGCRQSLVELAVGLNTDEVGRAHWLAMAARCVGCGRINGLTDLLLPGMAIHEVFASI